MARKRINMKKIREIIRFKETSDMSDRKIARALNISRPVVAQYIKDFKASGLAYEEIKSMPDSEFLALFEQQRNKRCSKYEKLSKLFPHFVTELKRTGVTLMTLWNEYQKEHPDRYSYSQFCYHFQVWRNASKVTMHIEHKAGDKMFVDYTGDRLVIVDRKTGKEQPVEVFVAILGASQLTYAEASFSQKSEDWIRSNEHAFIYCGGVTQAIVPDNLKSGVTQSNRYEQGINFMFDDFAEYYQTVILPARVRSPKDKALVENAVNLVYQRIYAPLRNRVFYSLEELNEAIWDLLEQHNNTPFQRLKTSRRDMFDRVEKPVLKPLPKERYAIKQCRELTVQFNYHIELREDRHYYSVPWQLKGERMRVVYDDRNVAIYYDNIRIVQHKRDRSPNGYTTLHSHMPPHHRFYAQWSPERFLKWAQAIGDDVAEIIQVVLKSRKHSEQAFKTCMGILNLVKKHGPDKLNKACARALGFGFYSYKRIKNILDRGLEEEPLTESREIPVSSHENIRGSQYYQ
ncbi:MAG: IS21 family transposase [Thermodesulfobacteriota bacterium]|nr:IS21 family transposase [Thermodesulfobacteriota bacterium]